MIPDDICPDPSALYQLALAIEKHALAAEMQERMADTGNLDHVRLNSRYEFGASLTKDSTVLWELRQEINRRLPDIIAATVRTLADKVDRNRDALNLDISVRKDVRDMDGDDTALAA